MLVSYLAERMAEEADPQLAIDYWYPVLRDAGALSFDEINSVPQNKRGDMWTTTRKLMFAWCQSQASIEAGLSDAVLSDQARLSNEYLSTLRSMSADEIAELKEIGVTRG